MDRLYASSSKALLSVALEKSRNDGLAARDCIVCLPTSILQYLCENVLDVLTEENTFAVFDLISILFEVLSQRLPRTLLNDHVLNAIIKECSFKTSIEIKDYFETIDISTIEQLKNSFRRGCWVQLLSRILQNRREK